MEGFKTTTAWKVIRGFGNGSINESGSSGCGVGSVSKISALLKASTDMAARVAGSYIPTEVLGLRFGHNNNDDTATQWIEK